MVSDHRENWNVVKVLVKKIAHHVDQLQLALLGLAPDIVRWNVAGPEDVVDVWMVLLYEPKSFLHSAQRNVAVSVIAPITGLEIGTKGSVIRAWR